MKHPSFWSVNLDKMIVLRISDNDGVDLNGVKLHSTTEVAEALEKISAEHQFDLQPPKFPPTCGLFTPKAAFGQKATFEL